MPRKPRILLFTDSRGELKPTFAEKLIFPERVKAELESRGTRVDLILCPFKWTTTLDFLELLHRGVLSADRYDRIVLYTGVVDWSPRPLSSFSACITGTMREPLKRPPFRTNRRKPKQCNKPSVIAITVDRRFARLSRRGA